MLGFPWPRLQMRPCWGTGSIGTRGTYLRIWGEHFGKLESFLGASHSVMDLPKACLDGGWPKNEFWGWNLVNRRFREGSGA